MSNFAFSQTKINEFITVIFAMLGIESAIVASEMQFVGGTLSDENEEEIVLALWFALAANAIMILSIIGNHLLFIRWKRAKNYIIDTDTIFNTGQYKTMIWEIVTATISPYPFLYGVEYTEVHMYEDKTKSFPLNDLLLALMIFARVYFIAKSILSISFFTDPRS